jgi:multicomponent Na+:H+ antiporter subunit E
MIRRLAVIRSRVPWFTIVWITAVWVLLWGNFRPGTVASGLLVAVLVPTVLPLPAFGYRGRVRPLATLHLVVRFAFDLVVASFQVAFLAMIPTRQPRGAVVRIALRTRNDLYIAYLAELACMVPGSVTLEVLPADGILYVHVIDVAALGGIEKVRADLIGLEGRLLRAIGSAEELEEAGMGRRSR